MIATAAPLAPMAMDASFTVRFEHLSLTGEDAVAVVRLLVKIADKNKNAEA
jgi:hypothetical protein